MRAYCWEEWISILCLFKVWRSERRNKPWKDRLRITVSRKANYPRIVAWFLEYVSNRKKCKNFISSIVTGVFGFGVGSLVGGRSWSMACLIEMLSNKCMLWR